MLNPPPGELMEGQRCKLYPEQDAFVPPYQTFKNRHCHVNKHGVTFTCNSKWMEEDDD